MAIRWKNEVLFKSSIGEVFEYDSVVYFQHEKGGCVKVFLYSNIILEIVITEDIQKFLEGYNNWITEKYELLPDESLDEADGIEGL